LRKIGAYDPKVSEMEKELSIDWNINTLCNFDCKYCFPGAHTNDMNENLRLLDPEQISECFNEIGKSWSINITGGEPFLYPKFINLCTYLTQDNIISINTNLSKKKLISKFVDQIDPNNVSLIRGSVHIEEREKRTEGMDDFIRNIRKLKHNNFPVSVNYVLHPTLFDRFEEDYEYFQEKGIDIKAKVFRGNFEGEEYPGAYTDEQVNILENYVFDALDKEFLNKKLSFKGEKCEAGVCFFSMGVDGSIYRCSTAKLENRSYLGNLFDKNFTPFSKPKKCPFNECKCPYEGLRYAD